MAETVEIGGLPAAAVVTTTHELPTQKSGVTEKVTIAQILGNANIQNIGGTIQNTGLPSRLQELSPQISNANDAASGWSCIPVAATNSPDAAKQFILFTVFGNATSFAMQTAYSAENTTCYRRIRTSNVWSAWSALKDKVSELNASYQAAGAGTKYLDFMSMYIEEPVNGTYKIVQKLPIALTLKNCRAITKTGSCTVRGSINGTPAGAGASTADTTGVDTTYSTANSAALNANLELIVASVSSCTGLTVTFVYERNLELYS